MTEHPAAEHHPGDAIDWLAGRLRWEQTLRDLHDRAEGVEPVVAPVELPASADGDEAAA